MDTIVHVHVLFPCPSLVVLFQLAESCVLRSLKISFCYKLPPSELDILITTLKAKNSLVTFEIMGNTLGSFGVEFLSTCKTLTRLLVSGVNQITNDKLKLVSCCVVVVIVY